MKWFLLGLPLSDVQDHILKSNTESLSSPPESSVWNSWMRGNCCSSFFNTTASAGPPRINSIWVTIHDIITVPCRKRSLWPVHSVDGLQLQWRHVAYPFIYFVLLIRVKSFKYPPICTVWMPAAVVSMNRSCSVSTGLSQLAFWAWRLPTLGHASHKSSPKINSRRRYGKGDSRERGSHHTSTELSSGSRSAAKSPAISRTGFHAHPLKPSTSWW